MLSKSKLFIIKSSLTINKSLSLSSLLSLTFSTRTSNKGRYRNFDEENKNKSISTDDDLDDNPIETKKFKDLKLTPAQLKVGETVRRLIQRSILTGIFNKNNIDLRDCGFDVEDVHMSKDLSRATIFWNVLTYDGPISDIQVTLQKSVKELTHTVGTALNLRRIPLLVFRHSGMMSDTEEKQAKGRAGNRPGDVLRMYRMFQAFQNDPIRQQMITDSMKVNNNEDQSQLNEDDELMEFESNQKEGDDYDLGEKLNELGHAAEKEEFINEYEEGERVELDTENVEGADKVPNVISPKDKVWKRYESEYGFKIPLPKSDGDDGQSENINNKIRAWALEEANTLENIEKEKSMVDYLKQDLKAKKSLNKDEDPDVVAFHEEEERKIQDLLNNGDSRFTNSWFRKDKRDLKTQHAHRDKAEKLESVKETRLIKKVLDELESDEKMAIEAADNAALEDAINAQKELINENKISRDQVSDILLKREPRIGMLKKTPKKAPFKHVENIDTETKDQVMSVLSAAHVASKPVRGRSDIPITGPKLSHGPNQGLTYAEQMLITQTSKPDIHMELKADKIDPNIAKAKLKYPAFFEELNHINEASNIKDTDESSINLTDTIDPSLWKNDLENSFNNFNSGNEASRSKFSIMSQPKAKLYVPTKFANVKWPSTNKKPVL